MTFPNPTRLRSPLLFTAVFAALLLGACGERDDQRSLGQQVDSAVASAERKTDAARTDVDAATRRVTSDLKQGASDLKQGAANAAHAVSELVQDAGITASVNAALAKDSTLSALKIDVDTVDGRVSLRGTAPSAAARERASQLASNVKGVVDVQNKLEVRG